MGIVPACFCIVPNLGFTVHLYASPGVIDFPRPCSLACTATIISKSIFCQPPLKPTQSWGGGGQRFQVIYRRSVSPRIEQTFKHRDVDNIWNGSWTQAFRYPASPGHIGLAQSSSLTFRSIMVYTSNIHLASDGPSAFKSNSTVHSSQKGPIFTVDVPVWNNGPWAVTLHDGSCQGQGWHAKPLFTYWLRLKNHLWSLRGSGGQLQKWNKKCEMSLPHLICATLLLCVLLPFQWHFVCIGIVPTVRIEWKKGNNLQRSHPEKWMAFFMPEFLNSIHRTFPCDE